MGDARRGGIQAYQGHSSYVRGRKIRIDIPEPQIVQPELELADGTPGEVEKPRQVIVVDGEALEYESSIQWECFPANIEVLIDDSIFLANKTFSYKLTKEVERSRVYTMAVEKIWEQFDKDNSGALDKPETKVFLKTVLADIPPPNHYDEAKFEDTFNAIDKSENGLIEKREMIEFLKLVCKD